MDYILHFASGGHVDPAVFLNGIKGFLTVFYLAVALMNGIAALYLWHNLHKTTQAIFWLVVAMFFVILASMAGWGNPDLMPAMPDVLKNASNWLLSGSRGSVTYALGTSAALVVLFLFRRFFVQPIVGWAGLNLSLLFLGLSMTDYNFSVIVTKADNVPIVGLIFLLGFFTWLATYKAVKNDDRAAKGLPPLESEDNDKVLVWPDLVYTELICMIACTAFLILWAILLEAPLEEPASSVKTPNPSKAPWYFLGLQEMLVYFDPWMAGVVLPSLVVFGLMAIPYLDFNKKGIGYYTINERKFAYIIFQVGFLELWITLIILGTFLRGPNWNFFGPYEFWDAHKVEALNNIDLSQIFWYNLMDRSLPKAPTDSGFILKLGYILLREAPGFIAMGAYFVMLPPIMAMTFLRKYFVRMGFLRFMLMTNLLLFMALLPIKMVLRWTINLKYIIHIDEFFLNL